MNSENILKNIKMNNEQHQWHWNHEFKAEHHFIIHIEDKWIDFKQHDQLSIPDVSVSLTVLGFFNVKLIKIVL